MRDGTLCIPISTHLISGNLLRHPQLGGATNFMNAGIHIKPTKYAATFFSYIDPITINVDDGLIQHLGCPVGEGTKRIVTQWIRLGVDEENSWDSFDTLGVKIDVAENA